MYDRPTANELLEAARMHMETAVIPVVRENRKLYFQTLVAINVMKIVERELDLGAKHAEAEWGRLNALEGVELPLPNSLQQIQAGLAERNAALSAQIREGEYTDEEKRAALFDHLLATTVEQLTVANPRFLGKIQQEMQDPTLDAWEGRNEGQS